MRLMRLTLGAVALAAFAVASPLPQSTASNAFAEDDIPLPRPNRYCKISCLTGPTGNKYCGIGSGQIGCKSIINGNCVFVLCPIL